MKGTFGNSSWIFEVIAFIDSTLGPTAWSTLTASIPYLKNFLVELIKCSCTSGLDKFSFGKSENPKKAKCLYSLLFSIFFFFIWR